MRFGIRLKVLTLFFASFFIMIIILMNYLSVQFRDVLAEQAKNDAQHAMIEGKESFDELVDAFQDGCDYVGRNEFMIRVLNTSDYDKIENVNNIAAFNNNFRDIFELTIGNKSKEYLINLFINENLPMSKNLEDSDVNAFKNMTYGIYNEGSMKDIDWVKATKEKKGLIHVFQVDDEPDFIYISKCIKNEYKFNMQDEEYLGVGVFGIDLYRLMKNLEMRSGSLSIGLAVLDQNNNFIFKNKFVPDEAVLEATLKDIPSTIEKNVELKTDDYVVYAMRTSAGISFLSFISVKELYLKIEEVKYIIVISALVAILTMMIISIILSGYLTKPIKKLSMIMKSAKKQDIMEFNFSYPFNDEVGDLHLSFNKLMKQVKTLVQELELEVKRSTNLELKMYQLQINPHFLYNALDSIFWLSAINGQEKISNMTKWLVDIFRYSLKDGSTFAALAEEIEIVKSYIMLQQERYGREFKLDVTFEDGTENINIPKCIIQPIVENAIIHGLPEDDNYNFIIKIYTEKTDDIVNICVADNGIGCDIAVLDSFVANDDSNSSPDRIGIRNVNKRIKLIYGEGCGLSYRTNDDGGITAVLKIKINKNGGFLNENISEEIK